MNIVLAAADFCTADPYEASELISSLSIKQLSFKFIVRIDLIHVSGEVTEVDYEPDASVSLLEMINEKLSKNDIIMVKVVIDVDHVLRLAREIEEKVWASTR